MITLDFSKRQSLKVWAKEYDTARELNVQCIKDYVPIDITNCIITLNALKKDGTYIYNNGEIQDATNGKVTFPMTNQLLAVVGEVKADVSIYYTNGNILTSSSFIFDVDETIRNDEAIESSSEFTELTKAIIAESNRVLAENGRVTAENNRVSAETARVNAEQTRVNNETIRNNAENDRVSSENSRVSAESARVAAEEIRQTGYETMSRQISQLSVNTIPFSSGISLTTGYDLNNAVTQGLYYSSASAITTSLVNTPASVAAGSFLMLVAILGSNIIQIIFMPEAMHIRRKISTGWAAWKSVALS